MTRGNYSSYPSCGGNDRLDRGRKVRTNKQVVSVGAGNNGRRLNWGDKVRADKSVVNANCVWHNRVCGTLATRR